MSAEPGQITVLLRAVERGQPGAQNELISLIYSELRRIAYRQQGLSRAKDMLSATALVHEAYFRLFDRANVAWENRRHFFWAAARAMKDILVEEARRVASQKRGGHLHRVEFAENLLLERQSQQLLDIDESLENLTIARPDIADVVTLHFFGGLTHEETAELLELSVATVRRRWAFAKAWLRTSIPECT